MVNVSGNVSAATAPFKPYLKMIWKAVPYPDLLVFTETVRPTSGFEHLYFHFGYLLESRFLDGTFNFDLIAFLLQHPTQRIEHFSNITTFIFSEVISDVPTL